MALWVDFISEENVAEAVSLLDEMVPRIKDVFLAHFAQAMHLGEAFFEVVVVVRSASVRVDNRDDLLELRVAILERLSVNRALFTEQVPRRGASDGELSGL